MHRLLRVLIGVACFAAAGFLVYTCVLRMSGDNAVEGSQLRANGSVSLQLDEGVYGFWTVASTHGGWGMKSCGGKRNGRSLSAPLEDGQLASQAKLVPVGGGAPVALERGGCMRVTASSGDRSTATQFHVRKAGSYRLTVARPVPFAERFFLSTGHRFVDQLPRGFGAIALVVIGILIMVLRFGRPRGGLRPVTG